MFIPFLMWGRVATAAILFGSIFSVYLQYNVQPILAASSCQTLLPRQICIEPSTSVPGQTVKVMGGGFGFPPVPGIIWVDTNSNGVLDEGESRTSFTTNQGGSFTTTILAPSVSAGTYKILADIPIGGMVEASEWLTVTTAAIALTPAIGPLGTRVTISGGNMGPSASSNIWFDTNSNGVLDADETSITLVIDSGSFPAGITIIIPSVSAGTYKILADIPIGGMVEASATFTVSNPIIRLSPTTGPPGTQVTISGSGFLEGAPSNIWFDTNSNGVLDADETPFSPVINFGSFTKTIAVPQVSAGTYKILADIPIGMGGVEASATLTVTYSSPLGAQKGKIIRLSEAGSTIFQVDVEDKAFDITVTGEGITSLAFSQEQKTITLENDGTEGILEVKIPKELLGGEFTVMADDKQIDYDVSDTETHSTLLFDTPADSSIVTIHGTTVVPEFPVAMLVIAASVGLIILLANRGRLLTNQRTSLR